jgi:L-seryl-tRNA(Ser) seleniumtransferase
MLKEASAARRALPSVDRLLNEPRTLELVARYGRPLVVETLRDLLEEARAALGAHQARDSVDESALVAACAARLATVTRASLRPVFNLTGTVLHTNLGRALMPRSAAEAVVRAMTRAVNLEFDVEGAARGERDSHIEHWLTMLTGAEAAAVVNNNAAAVYLVLNTLAARREVLVSRGELVEIGGAFRIPDIMSRAGCKLREVGTTNRTHARDYRAALGPRSAAVMKVHTSNYAIRGFTAAVAERELAQIAREHGLPFVIDLGSGMLVDLENYGLPHEPTAREALAQGADLVTFSGDKLLGGPQLGIIAGRAELIGRLQKHPLLRALRVDKMTLAAFEATLRIYRDARDPAAEVPALRMLAASAESIRERAAPLAARLAGELPAGSSVEVIAGSSQVGAGSAPGVDLPTWLIAIRPRQPEVAVIEARLRSMTPAVLLRVHAGALLVDLRTVDPDEEEALLAALVAALVTPRGG